MVTATSSKPRVALILSAFAIVALFLVTLPISMGPLDHRTDVLVRDIQGSNSYFSISATLPDLQTFGSREPASWMSQLADDLPITAINLPATHDSTARFGGDSYACQSLSLPDQLALGVRFLDIRLAFADGVLNCQHGRKYQNLQFQDVLATVETFLSENPTEGVFIKIQQEHTSYSSLDFSEAVSTVLSDRPIVFNPTRPMTNETLPAMSEMRGRMMVMPRFFDLPELNTIPYEWLTVQDDFKVSLQSKAQSILTFYNQMTPTTNVVSPLGANTESVLQARHRKHMISEEQRAREAVGLAMDIGWNVNYFSLHNNEETPAIAAYNLNPLISLMVPGTSLESADSIKDTRDLQFPAQTASAKHMGVVMMDFIGPDSTKLIIESNFQI